MSAPRSMALGEILSLIPRVIDDVNCTLGASPCSPYLNTNANVSLGPLANDARHAVTEYTALLDSLHRAASTLSQCAIKVNESIQAHKRLVSAATRLPPEILGSIFVRALPPMKDAFRETDLDFRFFTYISEGRRVAINFAQVCRNWREIALHCTELWNPIFVKLAPESLGNRSAPVEELVRRANKDDAPLTLVVDASADDIGLFEREKLQEACQGSLAPFQKRCTAIEIDIREGVVLSPLLAHLSHPSGLSRLRLMGDIFPTGPHGPALLDSVRHPALADLTLQAFRQPLDFGRVFTPSSRWDKLVSLQLITGGFANDEAPHQVVRKLLFVCPSLRQLLVRATTDQGFASLQDNIIAPTSMSQQNTLNIDTSEIITSTSLRALVLVVHNTLMGSTLLSLLRCPSLHTLVISPFVMLPSLETFLTHAGSAKRLVITTNYSPVDVAVGKIRDAFPSLAVELANIREGKEWFALPLWYKDREDVAWEA
ncbi:hypothetical protein CONPUDRAFT_142353 [Coniophora puteana RWD-64-598 SS2]|uniref:F-box domain-containing protein n=1 Tax=Coniophora puteana (strain RWD-64-598) TaxID=741705 RepID=A0A5M3MYP3_CONPW|nr:uncharacterized protein CONPUDRAFT_142353 [Coniophora puteana RWD-64-598 SS2]EIW83765.1 hypothetical protein CONPUDRAFT_142353 [Coniophora puteana RWD-64-598 SS2]